MSKDLEEFEAALRLEISRNLGEVPEVEVPVKPEKVKNKYKRRIVLGISNDRGHTIIEFVHDTTHFMELPAEMEARKAAKAKGLVVHCVLHNTKLT